MGQSSRTRLFLIILLTLLNTGIITSAETIQSPRQKSLSTLSTIDIEVIGELDTGGAALRVHVENNLAFVIDFGESSTLGLIIVNVSNPTQPEIIGSFHDGGLPFALESKGNIVYIADQEVGLRIIDISDPSHPIQIEGYAGSGIAYDLKIVDNLLYLADQSLGLVILNISTPSSPVYVSHYESNCVHLDIEGDIAYITSHEYLKLVNVSDPSDPTYISQFTEENVVLWDPSVSDGMIYLANHRGPENELQIYDASVPTNIEKCSEFDSTGSFQSFYIQDTVLYAVDYEVGLYILDVTNSSSPFEIDRFAEGESPWDVVLNRGYVYLCGSAGLQIIRTSLNMTSTSSTADVTTTSETKSASTSVPTSSNTPTISNTIDQSDLLVLLLTGGALLVIVISLFLVIRVRVR